MADEIIEELWAAKDAIAKEADYDIDKLVDLLQNRETKHSVDPVRLTDRKG